MFRTVISIRIFFAVQQKTRKNEAAAAEPRLRFLHYQRLLFAERIENAGNNRRADNARNVRSHSLHENEVGGIVLERNLVGDAGGHRNGRNTGGTDERVDLLLGEEVHKLSHQDARGGADAERDETERKNAESRTREELLAGKLGADGKAEHDRHDIDERIGHRIGNTRNGGTRFLGEVAEHQSADKRNGRRKKNRAEKEHHEREADLLDLLDLTKSGHLDKTLVLGRKSVHDRGLNDRNESHVRIGRNRDSAQEIGSKTRGEPNRRRTVGAADDTDRGGRLYGIDVTEEPGNAGRETESSEEREEDTELSGTAEKRHSRVGDKGTKVRHSAYAHEDHDREYARIDTESKEVMKEAAGLDDAAGHNGNAALKERDRTGVHHRGSRNACERTVGEKSAEADRQKKKRLKALDDGEVEHQNADRNHDELTDTVRHAEKHGYGVTLMERTLLIKVTAVPLAVLIVVTVAVSSKVFPFALLG